MSERLTPIECTAAHPWNGKKEKGQQVIHEGACEVGEQRDNWPCGDLQDMECIHCRTKWTKELPQ